MNLKELVSETLKNIAEGAKDASDVMMKSSVVLNASVHDTQVEFDVLVSPTKDEGFLIAPPTTTQQGTRIKFVVPIRFPQKR